MSYDDFYTQWWHLLKKFYPSTSSIDKNHMKKSVSPFQVTIPQNAIHKITETIHKIFHWSHSYIKLSNNISQIPIKNYAVLMAYDFHLDSNNQPQLIEINTNASGFLVIDLINKVHGRQTQALNLLRDSFFKEWRLFSNQKTKTPHVVIIDHQIEKQNMKFEFLMYQDLIKSWGWNCEIIEALDIKSDTSGNLFTPAHKPINFIYNRLTDFYFEKYPILQQAYKKQTACFSPNPREYGLLGDKKNLCTLSSYLSQYKNKLDPFALQSIENTILKTSIIDDHSWENRKNLFFKPLTGYGGKSAYRGSSITKKKFKEFNQGIAQEYIPPSTWIDPITHTKWKIDIRVYVYKNTIQLIGGRAYQGQLTNFKNILGGFCSIST